MSIRAKKPHMNGGEIGARIRRPEYTGENRCVPCTVVNLLVALVAAVGLAAATTAWAGAAAFVGACAVVYVRGYLVPGTPTLTKRYFPPWLLRLFGKETVTTTGTVDGARSLELRDVVDLDGAPTLSPRFREAWRDRVRALDGEVTPADVAAAFDGEEARRLSGLSYVVDGSRSVRWDSPTALRADVAAAGLLAERTAEWSRMDHETRRTTLRALRLSLDRCPACGGAVAVETDRVDPCCQPPHLVAEATCTACDAPLADAAVVDDGDVDSVAAALLDG